MRPASTATWPAPTTSSQLTARGSAGDRQVRRVAIRAWLAAELSDWGAADDALLTKALSNMAHQFVDRDPELLPSPARELTSA